jgi:hypothetical protein
MINIIVIVPLYDEVPLLGWGYGATPEGRVDIEGCGFRKDGSVDNDASHIIKCAPIAPKVLDIDLAIDR